MCLELTAEKKINDFAVLLCVKVVFQRCHIDFMLWDYKAHLSNYCDAVQMVTKQVIPTFLFFMFNMSALSPSAL